MKWVTYCIVFTKKKFGMNSVQKSLQKNQNDLRNTSEEIKLAQKRTSSDTLRRLKKAKW